ncbi:MAG TPA: ATP-dependent DNA helicase RecG [Eggerthellaceae bacterium]|nr:ATP-dependent DNA helicase RecG [Eggerthellaceae bacterium]
MAETKDKAPIDRLRATLAFEEPVTSVNMVSPKRAKDLAKIGIATVRDLVCNFPHRYIDMSQVKTVLSAAIGESCTIRAEIHEVKLKRPRPNLPLVEIGIVDETGVLIVTAFRQPWLADQLKKGMLVAVSGKVEFDYGFKRMVNPYIEVLEDGGASFHGMIVPVHPLSGSVKAGLMRRLVSNALDDVRGASDPLPLHLRARYRLMSRTQALSCVHFPHTMEEQRQARRRLAYEEVLLLELMLMQDGAKRAEGLQPIAHECSGPRVDQLQLSLPFALTEEQANAKDDILQRMAAPAAMNHMLLGDVGTGKTVVAGFALAAAADSGGQALLMAPTEILAQQHEAGLGELLGQAGVSHALLTGSTAKAERARIVEQAADGSLDVIIGTHALIEDDLVMKNCTLAIIDEQQRFGVEQRAALLAKGTCPDALFLTATPIPRTLALALFGNLSLSYIKHRPRASAPRKTFVHTLNDRGAAYDAALAACARGEQVYVVCPLVGEKRKDDEGKGAAKDADEAQDYAFSSIAIEDERDMAGANVRAAEDEAAFLQGKVFVDYRVGLVHGRLKAAEKREVMESFRRGDVDVLVATTVIEVGVDVPNATVMIVEDADRFGLSQLHQLRGRVGRGELPGEVHLISGTRKDVALDRLAAMERTEDGFELASYDLSLRREGDILGNRQSGASQLKLVNIVRDGALIEAAHADALAILADDPNLESEQYRALGREARVVFRRAEELSGG